MFGMCIYPVLSLIYQTNKKNKHYENFKHKQRRTIIKKR